MTALAEFLLARIAEDEAAWEATKHPALGDQYWFADAHDEFEAVIYGPDGEGYVLADRVLAECEAKRRIVELHTNDQDCGFACRNATCATLFALAQPYAGHEEWREEWAL